MNLNTEIIEDNPETRKSIATLFCIAYNSNPNNHSDGEPYDFTDEDTADDIINSLTATIIENIDSEKENANSLFQKILYFSHHQLGKITFSEDEKINVITEENMIRNSSEIEVSNFTIIFDALIQFAQFLASKSSLKESETDDWDLDMINFSEIFFTSKSIRFDDSIIGYDHLIGLANEIRNKQIILTKI